jgi:hypothetical protein
MFSLFDTLPFDAVRQMLLLRHYAGYAAADIAASIRRLLLYFRRRFFTLSACRHFDIFSLIRRRADAAFVISWLSPPRHFRR